MNGKSADLRSWLPLILSLLAGFVACPVLSAEEWPSEGQVITEFGARDSALRPGETTSYMALGGDDAYRQAADGPVIFRDRLPGGLGVVEIVPMENNMSYAYGNLDGGDVGDDGTLITAKTASWSDERKPLIVMLFDTRERRVVNPEIFLPNPDGNETPTLRKLVFRGIAPDGTMSASYDYWSWYRRRSLAAGEYLIGIDWADGRFKWNDVYNLYSIRLYINGQLIYRQGLEFFQEKDDQLELYPGRSGNSDRIPVSIQPGDNDIRVYVEDPKGLSSEYEFTVNGGAVPPQ